VNPENNRVSTWRDVFPESERAVYELYRRKNRSTPSLVRSCLLVVDLTEAFIGPRLPALEAARESRTACGLAAWDALPRIGELETLFRHAGRPVVFAKPQWSEERLLGGTTVGGAIATSDDPIPLQVGPLAGELVLPKTKASAFLGTPLLTYLVKAGVDTVVIGGSTTSGCVRATAVDASSYGFDVIVVSDACFDRSDLSHRVALYELDVKYATTLSVSEVSQAIDTA
jgi:maleamate amidohydrolase